jgi:hypothetical protein
MRLSEAEAKGRAIVRIRMRVRGKSSGKKPHLSGSEPTTKDWS